MNHLDMSKPGQPQPWVWRKPQPKTSPFEAPFTCVDRELDPKPGGSWLPGGEIATGTGPAPAPVRKGSTMAEHVSTQAHYARFAIEPIDFVVANGLGYREGNIIKYVCRHPYKGQQLKDLYKARDYLERIIAEVEAGQ